MTDLPLSATKREAEWQTVLRIANSNNFTTSTIEKLRTRMNHKTPTENNQHNNKWTSFTYCTPTIRKITNLFKQTNIRITFRNTNTTLQKTKQKRVHTTQGFEQNGI
jgi:hypothetical protein